MCFKEECEEAENSVLYCTYLKNIVINAFYTVDETLDFFIISEYLIFVVTDCHVARNWFISYGNCPQKFAFWFCFIDSGIFLIYNEDSKLCAQAQSSSSVITAMCNENNELQRFRWISATQLLSMGMKLCLAVLTQDDGAAITLETCNRTSKLQRWECKDEALSIQDKDLFLNYGTGKGKKIRLSKESGKGSQWKIHGTAGSICSRPYEGEYWKLISMFIGKLTAPI